MSTSKKIYGIPYKHVGDSILPSPIRVIEDSLTTSLLYPSEDDAFLAKAIYWPADDHVFLDDRKVVFFLIRGNDRSAAT